MGKPLVRFCEGHENNRGMEEILWHRRESRRKRRKQTSSCSLGRLMPTRKQRGLAALLEGVGDQRAGRPKKPQRESALEKRLAASRAEIERLDRQIKLKEIVDEINLVPVSNRTKKK